jgi:hypothetical protein
MLYETQGAGPGCPSLPSHAIFWAASGEKFEFFNHHTSDKMDMFFSHDTISDAAEALHMYHINLMSDVMNPKEQVLAAHLCQAMPYFGLPVVRSLNFSITTPQTKWTCFSVMTPFLMLQRLFTCTISISRAMLYETQGAGPGCPSLPSHAIFWAVSGDETSLNFLLSTTTPQTKWTCFSVMTPFLMLRRLFTCTISIS